MAASLRVLRRRIRSTKNIAQITKAMEMVAASRISKAQSRVKASRPYADEFTHVLTTAARSGASDHPLLTARPEVHRVAVLVVTSDRGLCGGYNANVLRESERVMRSLRSEGREPVLFVIGGKGTAYFRFRNQEMAGQWTGFSEVPDYPSAVEAADVITAAFLTGGEHTVGEGEASGSDDDGESSSRRQGLATPDAAHGVAGVDEVQVVFTRFDSIASQTAASVQIAPLRLDEQDDSGAEGSSDDASPSAEGSGQEALYDFEPEPEQLFESLMPRYVRARVFAALLDAAASESAARQRAMKAATDNANDLVENLTRDANQARQAQITQEISEIVGGADALG